MAKTKDKMHGFKSIACKTCGETQHRVDINAAEVMCWKCTYMYASGYSIQELHEMTVEQRDNSAIFVKRK